ncbi:MAG: hypothetical protein LBH04_11570 [Tannerellaceae bacterium]|nr:hypothetical protein [Tannerellaceae bacterium]
MNRRPTESAYPPIATTPACNICHNATVETQCVAPLHKAPAVYDRESRLCMTHTAGCVRPPQQAMYDRHSRLCMIAEGASQDSRHKTELK